ncbi:MAG: NADH-quinone oxidoreductase, E subunit, NADH dehydrogenase I subunit E [Candidatus Moranbacteria bacterium GW2011_GWC1_45_18]|nr:MAG: NADH:ubiquinone oxidoreductase 24 kD subunit [Candidatus Moranbacteria bacterium GW2011_GWC2_40_12]KKT33981.1 MAG: NADH:ubiquinone oxidoreductase 24 kD subunit [Candidatus Moranbacteria bacterium GW2011_GWF2_44_10]KKT70364.1 MAG: NADH:ubiquinone oxidoreductase 24 kD subunit [Candidatus Moranbacteria bacterium GW2011_GWF1_44_4]KKT99353.1 MAG: NADH-quinone oxidoreductase, E subunit, NADH dehydrogenase I subunit E [Candidatus Moranbacteria bacterium GW2011_GWC1_45_18]OGI24142.1 MAG: hypoth
MSLQKILLNFEPRPENLLAVLKKTQKENKYIGKKECEVIADYFSLPLARVYSFASFFDGIRTKKDDKKIIKICSGGPCLSENSKKVARQIEMFLGVEVGNDIHSKYRLEYMSCLGLCDRGPIVEIEGNIFERVKPETVDDILKNYL